MWGLVTKELIKEKVLAVTDLHNVEAFCVAYSRWRDAEEHIRDHGSAIEDHNGRFYKNPSVTVANESLRQIATFGSFLGLDPTSRTRLIGGNKVTGINQFAEF